MSSIADWLQLEHLKSADAPRICQQIVDAGATVVEMQRAPHLELISYDDPSGISVRTMASRDGTGEFTQMPFINIGVRGDHELLSRVPTVHRHPGDFLEMYLLLLPVQYPKTLVVAQCLDLEAVVEDRYLSTLMTVRLGLLAENAIEAKMQGGFLMQHGHAVSVAEGTPGWWLPTDPPDIAPYAFVDGAVLDVSEAEFALTGAPISVAHVQTRLGRTLVVGPPGLNEIAQPGDLYTFLGHVSADIVADHVAEDGSAPPEIEALVNAGPPDADWRTRD